MTSGSYIAEVDAAPVWRLLVDVRELGCAIDPSGSSGDAVRIARALDAAERADGLAGFIAAAHAAREVDDG